MSWSIKDEWIDLAQAHHVVVYHNPHVMIQGEDGKPAPVTHVVTHAFNIEACPTCGHTKRTQAGEHVDFAEMKGSILNDLNGHHQSVMAYRELHKHVRLGSGPK